MKLIKNIDNYSYLLSMSIYSLTKEKINELTIAIDDLKHNIKSTNEMTIETLWLNDLTNLKD